MSSSTRRRAISISMFDAVARSMASRCCRCLSTPPMMAERRLVVVRDVHALKKDARTALDRYLAAPAPDVVALLVTPAGAKTDAPLASVSGRAVEFEPLTGDRVPSGSCITSPRRSSRRSRQALSTC